MNVKVKGGGVNSIIEFLTSEKYRVFISIIGTLILCICSLIWFNVSETRQTSKKNTELLTTVVIRFDSLVISNSKDIQILKADVEWVKEKVITQGNQISVMQGQYNQRGKYFHGTE